MIFLVQAIVLALCLCGPSFAQEGDYKNSIFVANKNSITGITPEVKFDHVALDVRGAYDTTSGHFYAAKDGHFFASLSAGAKPSSALNMGLLWDNNKIADVTRKSTTHNGNDTLSRDIIIDLKALESISVASNLESGLHSSSDLETSLSIFRLTGLMVRSVFFSAVSKSEHSGVDDTTLPFDEVPVNEGLGFDETTNTFVAPHDGYYFFSFSVGIPATSKFLGTIRKNMLSKGVLESGSTGHNEVDTLSRAGMLYLLKNDRVYITIDPTSKTFSDEGFLTSFSGFKYDPIHKNSFAWFVSRTTGWSGVEPLTPVTFDQVNINLGNGWDETWNNFTATVGGLYYVTFSVGAAPARPVNVSVMVNNVKYASLVRTATTHNGVEVLSRSAIVKLNKGDACYLQAQGNTAIFSNSGGHTAFTGLLLFPHK